MALTDSAKETVEYMFSLTPKPGKLFYMVVIGL